LHISDLSQVGRKRLAPRPTSTQKWRVNKLIQHVQHVF